MRTKQTKAEGFKFLEECLEFFCLKFIYLNNFKVAKKMYGKQAVADQTTSIAEVNNFYVEFGRLSVPFKKKAGAKRLIKNYVD